MSGEVGTQVLRGHKALSLQGVYNQLGWDEGWESPVLGHSRG